MPYRRPRSQLYRRLAEIEDERVGVYSEAEVALSELTHNFEMKLLTTSKDVGLRRLRAFAAPLGGSGQVFHLYEDVLQNLRAAAKPHHKSIVLHDHTVNLSAGQLAELQTLARVFMIRQPRPDDGPTVPAPAALCWKAETYAQCSLAAFLDSPVLRMSMTQMVLWPPTFSARRLLRWGHAAETWSKEQDHHIVDASLKFSRSLCLTGEARRLVEVCTHFLQVGAERLNLSLDSVTFGSDGMLILVAADCQTNHPVNIQQLTSEVRQHQLPISIVNHSEPGRVEITGLFYPHNSPAIQDECMMLVFVRRGEETGSKTLALPEAG